MEVTGKITDEFGDLSGAEIILLRDNVRTNVGGISDSKGKFKIDNKGIKEDDLFEISYLGYESQIKKAKDLKDIEIKLKPSVEQLDEVLITDDLGDKPKKVKKQTQWYNNKALIIGAIGLVTAGVIIYIVKNKK